MSRLDELPPDQRAALSLLLRQRKSYAEVALLLGIAERAVHDRAHAALAVLCPRQARELAPEQRQEIGDYLLGQQASVSERLRTRTLLNESEPARAWAQAIAGELAPLGGTGLPEIPPSRPLVVAVDARPAAPGPQRALATTGLAQDAPAVGAPSSPAGEPGATSTPASGAGSPPSSRLGGALLLAAILVAVVVAVILLTSSGGGSSSKTASSKSSSTSTTKTGPTVSPELPLHSPDAKSKTVGVVAVLSEKGKRAFYIEAQHLPATSGFFYAIWLYNSPTSAEALSRGPAVGSNHKLAGGAPLPANAGQFREILLTRETNPHPTQPGHVVLSGAFSLGS